MAEEGEENTMSLILKSVIFDQQAGFELSKRLPPSALWTIKIAGTMTWIGGFVGFYLSSKSTSKIFMAENSHRKPTLKGGWLKYHQEKQRRMILGGMRGGAAAAIRWGTYAGIFTGLQWAWEEILDVSVKNDEVVTKKLHERDLSEAIRVILPGPLAGVCSSGLFAISNKLWYSSSKRVLLFGALFGSGLSVLEQANIYINSKSIKRFN